MAQSDTIRVLEGLGYVSAFMVAAGSLVQSLPLQFVKVTGIFFALVVFVRLMVILATRTEPKE